LALSVPLSRFTSRVGGGSAFYVRRLDVMDSIFAYAVTFALAFSIAFIVAQQIHAARMRKIASDFKRSADAFKKGGYGLLIKYNRDSMEVLKKMEMSDFEGAKHDVSYGIALFYHNECDGLSEEFETEKRKIEELAESIPILASNLERAAAMQKIAVEMKKQSQA